MSFDITGKLYRILPTESKSEKFQTREFVLEIMDGNYPQLIKFQLVQDRCALIDAYQEGEEIKVHFDLRGREWQGKFFSTLNCWRLERPSGENAKPVNTTTAAPKKSVAANEDFPTLASAPLEAQQDDDLPF
jgi:single-strand DNA-binding protein